MCTLHDNVSQDVEKTTLLQWFAMVIVCLGVKVKVENWYISVYLFKKEEATMVLLSRGGKVKKTHYPPPKHTEAPTQVIYIPIL